MKGENDAWYITVQIFEEKDEDGEFKTVKIWHDEDYFVIDTGKERIWFEKNGEIREIFKEILERNGD